LLSENDWPLFKVLREWRGELSKKEGIPPYIICTNIKLAKLAVMRPSSLNGLQEIDEYWQGNIKLFKTLDLFYVIKIFWIYNHKHIEMY
jgi:superfamily II DNA helicase RecQ